MTRSLRKKESLGVQRIHVALHRITVTIHGIFVFINFKCLNEVITLENLKT